MALQFNHSSNFTKMVIIAEFLVVSYLLYSLTKSVYQSYQTDQVIQEFQNEINTIAEQNKQKQADYSYYTSDAYEEEFAKQNDGLVNPGEQVIVIPATAFQDSSTGPTNQNSGNPNIQLLPNTQKWWNFFFDNQQQKK